VEEVLKENEKKEQATKTTSKRKTSSTSKAKQVATKKDKETKVLETIVQEVETKTLSTDKEKSFEMLFAKKKDKTTLDSSTGKIDNLQKLREQIFAQKRLERELMEKEAKKVKELDEKIASRIPGYTDELVYEVDENLAYQLEQENKELLEKIEQLEYKYQTLLHSKYNNIDIFDKNTLEISPNFLEALQRDLNANILDEFSQMQKELQEIRSIYQQKEQSDLLLKKKIDEFQNIYFKKQQEVDRLKTQIEFLESSVPELKDTLKQKAELEEIKRLLDLQILESEKYLNQIKEYEKQIQELKELNIKQAAEEKESISKLEKTIVGLNETVSKLQIENEKLSKLQQENLTLQEEINNLQTQLRQITPSPQLEKEFKELQTSFNKLQTAFDKQEKELKSLKTKNQTLTQKNIEKDLKIKELESKLASLDNMEQSLQEKDNEINNLQTLLQQHQETITQLRDVELVNIHKQLEEKNLELTNVQTVLTSKDEELTKLQDELQQHQELSHKYNELTQEVGRLTQTIDELQTEKEQLVIKQTNLETTLTSKNQELVNLQEQLNKYQNLENENVQLINEINQLKEQLSSYQKLQDDYQTLNNSLVNLQQELQVKDGQIKILKTDKEQLQIELTELQENTIQPMMAELQKKDDEITVLQEKITLIENETVRNYEEELEAKDQEILYLKNEVSRLENHIQSLEEKIDTSDNELQKQLEKVTNENEELKDKIYVQELEIADQKEYIENQSQLLSALQDRLADLEEENYKLHQTLKESEEKARSCTESLELKREAFTFLEEKVVSLEQEVTSLKDTLEKVTVEKEELLKTLNSREEKIASLQEEIAILSTNITSESEESKKFESLLAKKDEQIKTLTEQNEQLMSEINQIKLNSYEIEKGFKEQIVSLQTELANLHTQHKSKIMREKEHYESLIVSFQNQINQERYNYEEAIKRLEQRINELEQFETQKRHLLQQEALYKAEIEAKNQEINNLNERINELEKKVVDRDSLQNLERQIREIMMLLNETTYKKFETTPLYTPYYTPYHIPPVYQDQSSDNKLEALKQEFQRELALRDQLINLLREERKQTVEHDNTQYLIEISNLRKQIDELQAKLATKVDVERVVEKEVEEEPKVEDLQEVVFTEEFVEEEINLEPRNKDQLKELDLLIEQKKISIDNLIQSGHHSTLRSLKLEGDLFVRANKIITMYEVLEQKANQEDLKYIEALNAINERVDQIVLEIKSLQKRIYELDRQFNNPSLNISRNDFEVQKSKLHMELQVRQENLRSLIEEDAYRVRAKYLSFLREKEAQLLKLTSEAEHIIENYHLREARKEELRRLSEKVKEVEQQKFDIVPTDIKEKVAIDVVKLQEDLKAKKDEHQRLYQNLLELRKEVAKRNELAQILRRNQLVVDYINSSKTLEQIRLDYERKYQERQTIKSQMEMLNPETDKNQIFKLKATLSDLDIILDDLLTKQEYGENHLEELRKDQDVQKYAKLSENMAKLNNIIKKHIDRLQTLKEDILQLENTLKEEGMLA